VRRYTDLPLPAEPYQPGRGAHPRSLPAGAHLPVLAAEPIDPDDWRRCVRWLYAVDLFNAGCWWEVHEVLEGAWLASGRTTPGAVFVQGLIQIAAALLKRSQDGTRDARSLRRRGAAKLRSVADPCMGLHVSSFLASIDAYFAGEAPRPPVIELRDIPG